MQQNDMACPETADGEDGLHMWMEAANILNNESRIADKDDPQVEVWA
jgi:hypothetical protein